MSTAPPVAAVTGGTGFLGRWIVRALATAGWRPRLLVRGDPVHPQLADLDVDIVPGSLSDWDSLRRLVTGADVIVHAAGAIKALDRHAFRAVNVDGAARLARVTAEAAPRARIVYVSSLAARMPDLSDYAASKADGERALIESGLTDWVVVRPAAVYGAWDRETLRLFRAAAGPVLAMPTVPGARVCMIHVADVASAVSALARPGPVGRIFELSDAWLDGYEWPTIGREAVRAVGGNPFLLPMPAAAVRAAGFLLGAAARLRRRPSILMPGKAREILHPDWSSATERQPPPEIWRPRVGLADGFDDTARWYVRNGWLAGGPTARPN